jgi:hypothetical protein
MYNNNFFPSTLADQNIYWNDTRTFVMTLAYHMNITNPYIDVTYFLMPTMLSVEEFSPDNARKSWAMKMNNLASLFSGLL